MYGTSVIHAVECVGQCLLHCMQHTWPNLQCLRTVCRYGVGSRFKLKHTRSIINAIHSGELNDAEYQRTPIFDLRVRPWILTALASFGLTSC